MRFGPGSVFRVRKVEELILFPLNCMYDIGVRAQGVLTTWGILEKTLLSTRVGKGMD